MEMRTDTGLDLLCMRNITIECEINVPPASVPPTVEFLLIKTGTY